MLKRMFSHQFLGNILGNITKKRKFACVPAKIPMSLITEGARMAESLFSLLRMLVIWYIKYNTTYFLLCLTSLKVAAHARTDVHNRKDRIRKTAYERKNEPSSTTI